MDGIYIPLKTLLEYCHNTKDHCITANDLMRMNAITLPMPAQQTAHSNKTVDEVMVAMIEYANHDTENFKLGDIIRMTPSQVGDALTEAWELNKKEGD